MSPAILRPDMFAGSRKSTGYTLGVETPLTPDGPDVLDAGGVGGGWGGLRGLLYRIGWEVRARTNY
jgi:hypothetical protein